MKKIILVVGGTGMLGQPVSRSLNEAGFQVRVMTRDHQKAAAIFDDSFEIFAGDPLEPGCLEEAIHGCHGVHISLPSEVEQQVAETVAKVSRRYAVERITYISGRTVAEQNCWFPMTRQKFLAEKAIRESGVPYTIFCPTWIMESLPLFVRQGQASVLGKQHVPYHWVAAQDLASMVATAYTLKETANQRFLVLGPEAIRMQEALQRYCAALHPEIKQVSSMPLWLVGLLAAVTRNRELKGAGEMMSYFEKVGEGDGQPQAASILGAPRMTLDRWLQARKAAA